MEKMKALIICPTLAFFVSHRMFLLSALEELDLEVTLVTGWGASNKMEENAKETLSQSAKINHFVCSIKPGISFVSDLIAVFTIILKFWRVKSDIKIIHGITAKGCLITTLISHFFRESHIVFSVSGLGQLRRNCENHAIFIGLKSFILLSVNMLFKFSLRNRIATVIVQTEVDKNFIIEEWGVKPTQIHLHRFGVGVDLRKYPTNVLKKKPIILMASRLLHSKGVFEFIDAAKIVNEKHPNWSFELYGAADYENGDGISTETLIAKLKNSPVRWKGYMPDLSKCFLEASIMCLPTKYGEGIPKVLIEGAAAGCYLVTSAIPGFSNLIKQAMLQGEICETITPETLAEALCNAIQIDFPLLQLAKSNVHCAQNNFSVENISNNHKNLYKTLLNSKREADD